MMYYIDECNDNFHHKQMPNILNCVTRNLRTINLSRLLKYSLQTRSKMQSFCSIFLQITIITFIHTHTHTVLVDWKIVRWGIKSK